MTYFLAPARPRYRGERPAMSSRRRRQADYWGQRLADTRLWLTGEKGYCSTHRVVHGPTSRVRDPHLCNITDKQRNRNRRPK